MKYVIALIYILYIIVYGYSAHITSIESDNKLWGYICAFVFTVLSIWSVSLYTKYFKDKEKNSDES